VFKRSLGLVLGVTMVGTALVGGSVNHAAAQPPPVNVTCFEQTAIVATGPVWRGTSKSEVVYVPDGKYITVYGNGGNDLICSDNDSAKIYGGAGNDKLDGLGALYGDAGNDTITSDEFIQGMTLVAAYGGAGNDKIDVEGALFVDGGSGEDEIYADGSDEVHGGSGNDDMRVKYSGSVHGDAGDDWIEVRHTTSLDCGAGRDHFGLGNDNTDQIRRCEIEFNYGPI
jgi:Ca2+-binding RTX toxin-like protein